MEQEEKGIQDIQLIEEYLDDTLDSASNDEVKQRLGKDSEFNQLHKELNFIRQGTEEVFRREALQLLREREQNMPGFKKGARVVEFQRTYAAIAAAVALIVVTYFVIFQTENLTSREIYVEYYQPYTNLINPETRSDTPPAEESLLHEAMRHYDQRQYLDAVIAFGEMEDNDKQGLVWLYEGISLLELNRFEEAQTSLRKACEVDTGLVWQCQWFSGLGYLKEGDVNQATAIFEELMGSGNPYSNKANQLLTKINE